MKIKQRVLLILILIGLGTTLIFTFNHFKKEEEKILENKAKNEQIENEKKEEQQKKELEEKKKKEAGQKEVKMLFEKLQTTKKIILGIEDSLGTLETLDNQHKYKEYQVVEEEETIKEIVNLFAIATWQENKNDNHLGKIWQFFDSENNLIVEYDGTTFYTKEKNIYVFIETENLKKLKSYFLTEES